MSAIEIYHSSLLTLWDLEVTIVSSMSFLQVTEFISS